MKPSPAFQFYPADFLVGTADMTSDEVGGYIRLLCYQWTKEGLPTEIKKLMQLSGLFDIESLKIVLSKFIIKDNKYYNERLESVRIEQNIYREKQSEISRKSWEKRRENNMASHTEANTEPMQTHIGSVSSSPSSSSLSSSNTLSTKEKKSIKKLDYSFLQNEPTELVDAFRIWFMYKSEIKNNYKTQTSLETAYKHLKNLTGQNLQNAKKIVEQSIANQYKGLFQLKENSNYKSQNNGTHQKRGTETISTRKEYGKL